MIEESATVLKVFDKQVLVQVKPSSACGSCHARSACGQGILSKYFNQTPGHIQMDKQLYSGESLNVSVGDELLIGIEEGTVLKGAFFAYLLPLLFIVAFSMLAKPLQIHSELMQIIWVSIALILGMLSANLVSKKQGYLLNNMLPVILKKQSINNKIPVSQYTGS